MTPPAPRSPAGVGVGCPCAPHRRARCRQQSLCLGLQAAPRDPLVHPKHPPTRMGMEVLLHTGSTGSALVTSGSQPAFPCHKAPKPKAHPHFFMPNGSDGANHEDFLLVFSPHPSGAATCRGCGHQRFPEQCRCNFHGFVFEMFSPLVQCVVCRHIFILINICS